MTLTPKEYLERDDALTAKKVIESLPEGHPDRVDVARHLDHLTSPAAYQEYYRTMRGGICPEAEVFTRHKFVTRFATIRRLILERKHKTVLDLGCLDGWQLLSLAASGVTGVGVDLCPEALAVARERTKKWGFDALFIECAIENFDIRSMSIEDGRGSWNRYDLGFDAVILSEVLEHVLDPAACFRTAVRHLSKEGILYVSVPATPIPHHGKLEDAREHLRVFSEADLRALAIEAGLAVVEDHELIDSKDGEETYTNRTISFRRAKITMYCNHVTGGWRPDQLDDTGASEEMVVKTAEAWVRAGYAVTVHQNGYDGMYNGVAYLSRTLAPEPDCDLLVLFKTLEHVDCPAGTRIFWTTDLPQPGQVASFLPPRLMDTLDAVMCISEYHRQELLKACAWLSSEKTKAHWLGVDSLELSRSVHDSIGKRVIYASSLDRGLGYLLEEWPKVREAVPEAELRVTYGFDFWKRSEAVLTSPQAEEMRRERLRLEELLKQPGVTFLGRLPRQDFLREINEASVWAYPCTGGELCCKTALEAQFLGLYPVVMPTMSLKETVFSGSKVPREQFTVELIRVLKEDNAWTMRDPSGMGLGTTIPTWDDLATYLWSLRKEKSGIVSRDTQESVSLPTDTGVLVPAPLVFDRPRRIAVPRTCLDIIMAVRGMPFDGSTDREKNLGGSETAAAQLSRELVKRGHHVSVFSNLPGQPGKFDGVNYLPVQEWGRYAASTCHDVSIVQRDPMAFNQLLRSKVNVLWCHDLGLQRYRGTFRPSLWNVDYIVPVSHWHGRQMAAVYDLPSSLIVPMRNGVDADMLQQIVGKGQMRDRKALVYASRPERGLDVLLQSVFPRLLERDPELTLYIAGYENTVPEMAPFYEHCQRLIANFGQRAKWMGYLKKPDLYNLYSRAGCYVYPSRSFEEVSCISAMEAAACGLPFVGTTLGALPETTGLIPGFAQLVPHPDHDATEEFIGAFVETCWDVLTNEIKSRTMSNAGRNGVKAFSWAGVAEEWEDFMLGAIEQRSCDGRRVARQWWRLGDLNGLQTLSEEDRTILTPTQQKVVFDAEPDEPTAVPAHVIQAVIQAALEVGAKTVGSLTRSNDPNLAEAVVASGLAFMNAGPADFMVGIETLDCSEDPVEHIQWAETIVNPGGHVCLILAAPGTHQDRLTHGLPRRRRWVFDNHDARELLGRKRDLLVGAIGGGSVSAYDHSLLTWSLYRWAPSGINDPSAKIDLARRRWLQAPSPTLSACLIVKDAENMLHRCLKSIEPYCDEIIVDDTGSTDSTKVILAQHSIEPMPGLSPLDVGFDEIRNEGLRRATGDFVLWIDADEELLDGFQLPKYLRWSMYDGFGISQHHFSAIPPNAFKPDLPVRVFRRMNLDGTPTGIRWWGFVHEHPEKAINESVGQSVVLSDVHIAHEGYLSETIRRRRFNRNIPLMFRDRLKYPQRVLGKFLMIRDWCHLARYQMESSGGQLTPEGAHYLEAAVEAYRRDFLGLTHAMAADGLQYYNEALQMLGRGFEVQLILKVGGLDGAPHEVNYSGRVASSEDLERLVLSSTRDLTGIWKGKYL